MYIGASRLARKASGNKDVSEALNRALANSKLINEKLVSKLKSNLTDSVRSGNEDLVNLLKIQTNAVERALKLKNSEGAQYAAQFQKGERLNSQHQHQMESYVKEMTNLNGALSGILKTSLLEISDSISKLVNGDSSNTAKLAGAKQLANALGNSGMFDKSDSFKQLLSFIKTQTEVTADNQEQLVKLVDMMHSEVQSVDKLNDLIKIAQDSSKSEEQQVVALDQISIVLNSSNAYWKNLTSLKDILNSNENVVSRLDKLRPLLKGVSDTSLQTRTLYTLQQIENGLRNGKGLGKGGSGSSKPKVNQPKKKPEKKDSSDSKRGMLADLARAIPGVALFDELSGGRISNTIDGVSDMATGYLGGKALKTGRRAKKAIRRGVTKPIARTKAFINPHAGTALTKLKAGGLKNVLAKTGTRGLAKAGKYGALLAGAASLMGMSQPAMASTMPMDATELLPLAESLGADPVLAKTPTASPGVATKAPNSMPKMAVPKATSGLKSIGKNVIGKAGGLANVAMGVFDYATADNTTDRKKAVASSALGAGGAWGGAAAGAALGTMLFPGVGTVIGGAIGGILGSIAGSTVGDAIVDATKSPIDDIPDEVKKQGAVAQACYIDSMLSSGDYTKDEIAGLKKQQDKLVNDQSIKEYADKATNGNLNRLNNLMRSSPLASAHPVVYQKIQDYINESSKEGTPSPDMKQSLDKINAGAKVGSLARSTPEIGGVPIKSDKNSTEFSDLSDSDQKKVSDILDDGMQSAKADSYSERSLVSKLMGWVSNVVPTGLYPVLSMGVDNISMPGNIFSPTKGEPGGSIPVPNTSTSKSKQTGREIAVATSENGLGVIAAKYESGGRGVGTVSTGKGDRGGVSYGKHQLASNTGSMGKFIGSDEAAAFTDKFAGVRPGSAEFTRRYKEFTGTDEGAKQMEAAQSAYLKRTHYDPLVLKVARDTGIDINKQGRAVQEAVYSSSIQYGGDSDTINRAFRAAGITANSSQEEMLKAIYEDKHRNVQNDFRSSSPQVRASVAGRIKNEFGDAMALNNTLQAEEAKKTEMAKNGKFSSADLSVSPIESFVENTDTKLNSSTAPVSNIKTTPMVLPTVPREAMKPPVPQPVVMSNPLPAPQPTPSSGSQSVSPPMNIDDYGLAFANKLLWD